MSFTTKFTIALYPYSQLHFLNGARTHSRQGKAREHGDGVGFVCLSFLLSVQEFLRRKKTNSYMPKFSSLMVVREFLRLKWKCLAVSVSRYLWSGAVGFWWVDALHDHDLILGYANISIISTYCCFCTCSVHVQRAQTRPPPPCANPRARWPTTSHVLAVPKPWLLRTESDQNTTISWCFWLFSALRFSLPQPGRRLWVMKRLPNLRSSNVKSVCKNVGYVSYCAQDTWKCHRNLLT
jgi:hypothetical protein